MAKQSSDSLYTPEQRAHIERELGEGHVDWNERMARWVITIEAKKVPFFAAPGERPLPAIPTRERLEQALEEVGVLESQQGVKGKKPFQEMKALDWLRWNAILNEGDPEDWVNKPRTGWGRLKRKSLPKLRRQLRRMLDEKRYYRSGRRRTPRHTKRLVLEAARAWDNTHGAWPTSRHRPATATENAKDYGPFLELMLVVFKPIRPDGTGVADLVRTIAKEGKPDLPLPRLKWPD